MIDTDKYEGHTPGPWEVFDYEGMSDEPSVKLKPDECWGVKETSLRPVTLEWVEDENGIDGERQDVRINDPPLLYADAQLIADAPLLLTEVKRLHEWIYHHANNLDAGGVHRMGTPQPLSTFADEAREVIGVKRGEVHYD